MHTQKPKPYLDAFKLRRKAEGVERRRNMSKLILEHAPNFPLAITYEDIDQAFIDWVEDALYIEYDGVRVPTYRLFSTQKISEYSQTWSNLDSNGNLILNFKTVTRENNPKLGKNQGDSFNIPGNRDYPLFIVPTLQENGTEAYEMYSMKQPMSVDFLYKVTLVTNKYALLNKMNELVLTQFKAINAYISPNEHPMPLTLDDVSDGSEYTINDRKFYSQTYSITLKGYIIREEDYIVTKLPSRVVFGLLGIKGEPYIDGRKPMVEIEEEPYGTSNTQPDDIANALTNPNTDYCSADVGVEIERKHHYGRSDDDFIEKEECDEEDDHYGNKRITIRIKFPRCKFTAKFTIDIQMVVENIKLHNVCDGEDSFILKINEEIVDLDSEIIFEVGDVITIEIDKENIREDAWVELIGFDPSVVVDYDYEAESPLDEIPTEEVIDVENDGE